MNLWKKIPRPWICPTRLLPLDTAGLEWELFLRVWCSYCWWCLDISLGHHLFSGHHHHSFQSLWRERKHIGEKIISLLCNIKKKPNKSISEHLQVCSRANLTVPPHSVMLGWGQIIGHLTMHCLTSEYAAGYCYLSAKNVLTQQI